VPTGVARMWLKRKGKREKTMKYEESRRERKGEKAREIENSVGDTVVSEKGVLSWGPK